MQFPVLLIVLISASVFRANCREFIDGPENQEASPNHPQHSPGGLHNPDFSGEEHHLSNGLDGLVSFEENSLFGGVDQQLKKDVTEQNQIELRGNSGKGSIKKLIKSLESMERKLTMANQELKMELQAIKEHQANISNVNTELKTDIQSINIDITTIKEYQANNSNINTELKMDLQYIGAVITNHTAMLESIQDLVTPPTTTTTTVAPTTTTIAITPPTTTTTTVAPTTTIIAITPPTTTTTTVAPTTTTIAIPAGFENFNGRVIRRTLSSDPKDYFDGCMSFCDRYGAKPFIPRSRADYQLYLEVKAPFRTSDYMWLPANDRQNETVLRWYNGELASSTLFEWRNGQDMIHNSESYDCLFYGCCSRDDKGGWVADVYLNGCTNHRALPPICEII